MPAGPGKTEEVTTLRDGTRLGSVRLDQGPVVVVRLDEATRPGARVRLDTGSDRAIRARRP